MSWKVPEVLQLVVIIGGVPLPLRTIQNSLYDHTVLSSKFYSLGVGTQTFSIKSQTG